MQLDVKSVYEFGAFRLDVADRQLKRAGEIVPLAPKVFELLVFMLANHGRPISKEELLSNVWPDSFVTDENLSRHISTLRKTLNEGGDGQKFIETLPKFGYRFTDQVRVLASTGEAVWAATAPAETPASAVEPDALPAPLPELLFEQAEAREVAVAAGWVTQAKPRSSAQPISRFRILAPLGADGKGDVVVAEDVRLAPAFLKRRALVFSLGLVVILGFVFGLYNWAKPRPGTLARASLRANVAPLTSFQGRENYPAFSPDDRQIAFTWDGGRDGTPGDTTDIYVKLLGTETPLRLTTNPAEEISPVWSPDGLSIAFMRITTGGAGIYLVPALGGPERELLTGFWSEWTNIPSGRLSWSPDGRFIAFAGTEKAAQTDLHLFLLSLNGLEKRQLTASDEDDRCPAFSPDGQTLAFIRGWDEIYLMPATGGEARRLTFDAKRIFGLAWTPDGREIIFSSARGGSPTLWKIAASGGAPEALQPGGEQVSTLALSHQGNRLAYTQNIRDLNLWQLELPEPPSKPHPPSLFNSSTRQESQPQFSPDGKKVVFVSLRSGNWELWVCDDKGQNPVQLTHLNGPFVGSPRWSPDGNQIAFESRVNQQQPDIYAIAASGGTAPRRLTLEAAADIRPTWSHDGQWLYFSSNRSGDYQLWKQPSAGGPAVQLTWQGGREAYESPDGQFLYYTRSPNEPGIWRVPVTGGAETRVLEHGRQGAWAMHAQGIYLVNAATKTPGTIEFFSFATARKTILAGFEKDDLYGFTVSAAARRLLWSQIDRNESDLVLLENFR
ncbi:MAG: PD40 domain-containing protein [Acidobacteria bacterium]|nr:PD40 domain-containing protein [Acidobacteriota bacterium]MBI3424367.1 PD40 domain-containing protein [Acidobacteriota bacterium]